MFWKPVNQGLITTVKDQWKFSKIEECTIKQL